jgi:hypothetical protein
VVLAGVPLSLLGAGALVLALAPLAFPSPARPGGIALVALLAALLGLKVIAGVALPARGFSGEYFANDRFEGAPHRRIDPALDFDPDTFRRELFNANEFRGPQAPAELLPFSVAWRGAIVLDRPTPVVIDATATDQITITVDGGPPPATALVGRHEIVVRFARRTPTPPSLRVTVAAASAAGTPEAIPVFAGPPTTVGAVLAQAYAPLSVGPDGLVGLLLVWSAARGLGAALAARPQRWLPPFSATGLAVIAFWFAVGAARTAAHFRHMEFLDHGDDWFRYEAMARAIVGGDLRGYWESSGHGTFLYPYFVAALHVLFGEGLWPIYFAQYLILGLACVALGTLGRELWGERRGLAVLLTATAVAWVDASRWYAVRLLSENLALLMAPLAFFAAHRYLVRRTVATAALAGLAIAGLALTRLNLLPFGFLAIPYLVTRRAPGGSPRAGVTPRAALVAAFLLAYALLPLHERIVAGVWTPVPVAGLQAFTAHEGFLVPQMRASWLARIRDIALPNWAFMLGYPKLWRPEYSIRPHWVILWALYFVWIWRGRAQPTLGLVHLYVVCYVAVMSVFASIWIYGFRHVLPLVFVLSFFAPSGFVELVRRSRG